MMPFYLNEKKKRNEKFNFQFQHFGQNHTHNNVIAILLTEYKNKNPYTVIGRQGTKPMDIKANN